MLNTAYCQNKENWHSKSKAEKLQAVKDMVREVLWDELADDVSNIDVVKDLKDDEGVNKKGFYKDGVVSMDEDHLYNDEYDEIAEVAFHEAMHAVNDQNGWPEVSDLDGEPVGPGNYWTDEDIYISQKGSLRDMLGDSMPVTDREKEDLDFLEEQDASDYGEERLIKEKEKCSNSRGVESSSKNSLPKGDWVLPSKETAIA